MNVDRTGFVYSLARWLAASASLQFVNTPRAVWAHQADETGSVADPYTVVRSYGGQATRWQPLPTISVQLFTKGQSNTATLQRADALHALLTDAAGRPLQNVVIPAYTPADAAAGQWRIVWINILQPPALLGRDPTTDRAEVSFNIEIGFNKVPA